MISVWQFFYYSMNNNLPSKEIRPEPIHTIRLIPTEPDRSSTPFGDTNIPLPMFFVIG